MNENNDRQQLEYEFVMEGITTRMQIALEKMADSNRMMSETNKRLCTAHITICAMLLVALIMVTFGLGIGRRSEASQYSSSEVTAYETTIPQLGQGADDR